MGGLVVAGDVDLVAVAGCTLIDGGERDLLISFDL